ncbi:Cyclic nucleotide-gated cation channel alpha-3 [Cyphomyrmex costatus]|uniref:Cyclic nucleotide-gated cation channel alpha-3 n=1 Tax=Cyphomyrmex costatus TaxID=456900 RepID=A0A151INA8_9HYME|nr:Cyclic nucleotide-gated cation channel alpha-3 [Cyphomyrmex costatus]
MLDYFSDVVFIMDVIVQFRTGYLEQGLMVYDGWKLVGHYLFSKFFFLDIFALTPLSVFGLDVSNNPILRFPRFLKIYRLYYFYYMVESRTVYPNFWRVLNLIHILLILAHWFGCFYYLLSEAEGFKGEWFYPYRPDKYFTLDQKYLACLYWATLMLTTIDFLRHYSTPENNAECVT